MIFSKQKEQLYLFNTTALFVISYYDIGDKRYFTSERRSASELPREWSPNQPSQALH